MKKSIDCKYCQEVKLSSYTTCFLIEKYLFSFSSYLNKPIEEILNDIKTANFEENDVFNTELQTNIKVFISFSSSKNFFTSISQNFQPNLKYFCDLKAIKHRLFPKIKKISDSMSNSKISLDIDNENNKPDEDENDNPFNYVKKTRVKLADERLNKSGSFMKDLEKHLEDLSFETTEFNIYNPQYSSEESFLGESFEFLKEESSPKIISSHKLLNFDEKLSKKLQNELFFDIDIEKNQPEVPKKLQNKEDKRKKLNLANRNFNSISEKNLPIFLIKKNLTVKKNDLKNEIQTKHLHAGLRRNQISYNKSMNTNPLHSSNSVSNALNSKCLPAETKSKIQEQETELEQTIDKKKGLKEKIMEMNKIYNKKPVFSTKLLFFKEK